MIIQRDGIRALDRLSNDIELVMLLRFILYSVIRFTTPDLHYFSISSANNFKHGFCL